VSPIRVTTSRPSLADRICAEIEDPSFDTRPLEERRFIRAACRAKRKSEAQDEALRDADVGDPPEVLDQEPAFEPDDAQPDDWPPPDESQDDPDYP
jgi:hypothetical protein